MTSLIGFLVKTVAPYVVANFPAFLADVRAIIDVAEKDHAAAKGAK